MTTAIKMTMQMMATTNGVIGYDAYRLGLIDLEVKLTSQRINSYYTVQL